jgi:hypothetical protein
MEWFFTDSAASVEATIPPTKVDRPTKTKQVRGQPQGGIPSKCLVCGQKFRSKNKLHAHVRELHPKRLPTTGQDSTETFNFVYDLSDTEIIRPKATDPTRSRNSSWRFLRIGIRAQPIDSETWVCLDTGCSLSIIDKDFLDAH